MQINSENKEILKSISNINEQVYFTPDTLRVSKNDKTLIVYYDWGVSFSVPNDAAGNSQDGFGIYNLNELLGVLSLYDNPSITEGQTELTISEGGSKNSVKYTSKNCFVIPPTKDIIFNGDSETGKPAIVTPPTCTFKLSKAKFTSLVKQSQILKSPHVKFKDNTVFCVDVDDSSCNSYSLNITPEEEDSSMDCFISAENMQRLVASDYTVKVNDNMVIFESADSKLTYIIVCLTV